MNSILALKGWRLRCLMLMTQFLAWLGLSPSGARMVKQPIQRRAAMVPAKWMLRPMPDVDIERDEVEGRGGSIPIKRFLPRAPGERRLQILFPHGGGWVAGCEDTLDYLCTHMCAGTGAAVTSVGYRLAPEHPFPAGLDDCDPGVLDLPFSLCF